MGVCDVPVISSVCDAVGEGAASLVAAPFDWLAQAMGGAAAWLFEAVWTVFDTTTLVDVTDDGRAAVEDARRHRDDALTAALERLSDEHLELLAAATPALHELQQQLESIAPAPAVLGAAE